MLRAMHQGGARFCGQFGKDEPATWLGEKERLSRLVAPEPEGGPIPASDARNSPLLLGIPGRDEDGQETTSVSEL
jgi:hypothetical protein